MIRAKKIRLYPTKEQEEKMWQSVGTARFIYNWTLDKQEENYRNGNKFLSDRDLRKEITQLKKTDLAWLNEVSSNVSKQAVKDACGAYIIFFNKKTKKPKFKNINKTRVIRQLEKKLKRLQRQLARKYEMNKKGKEYAKTKNILKLLHRRLANISLNHVPKQLLISNYTKG